MHLVFVLKIKDSSHEMIEPHFEMNQNQQVCWSPCHELLELHDRGRRGKNRPKTTLSEEGKFSDSFQLRVSR